MPEAVRLGDIQSGHACHYPPTNAITGSQDVLINGLPAVRVGDLYACHGCGCCLIPVLPVHKVIQCGGSPSVFINGRPAARIGDPTACGGIAITGSCDVLMDDGGEG